MRLTYKEADEFRRNGWFSALATATKTAVPIFKVAGPRMLPTLLRKNNEVRGDYAFHGGEPFAPSEFVVENDALTQTSMLSITLVPTALSNIKTINNVRVPLDKACDAFEGLEAWVTTIAPAFKPPEPEGMPDAQPVTAEELRASGKLGAW